MKRWQPVFAEPFGAKWTMVCLWLRLRPCVLLFMYSIYYYSITLSTVSGTNFR